MGPQTPQPQWQSLTLVATFTPRSVTIISRQSKFALFGVHLRYKYIWFSKTPVIFGSKNTVPSSTTVRNLYVRPGMHTPTDLDQDNVGETPLHTAAKRGSVDVARILIEHGLASTMIPTKNGETPLHAVASHGMTDMAHFLISKNVDVNARDYEFMTPLHVAAEYFAVYVGLTF